MRRRYSPRLLEVLLSGTRLASGLQQRRGLELKDHCLLGQNGWRGQLLQAFLNKLVKWGFASGACIFHNRHTSFVVLVHVALEHLANPFPP